MIDHIHSVIREDLLKNESDLLNMRHYYTHKYRSNNRFVDINVGIFIDNSRNYTVQIYVANKENKIRERMIIKDNKIIDTDIIYKRY